jgi:hypothetical protein
VRTPGNVKGVRIESTYPSRFFGFGFWLWFWFWLVEIFLDLTIQTFTASLKGCSNCI